MIFSSCFQQNPLTLFRLGFLRVAQLGGGGEMPAANSYKTINDNEMKIAEVVKDH